jgi:DNA-damage-inducible protein D
MFPQFMQDSDEKQPLPLLVARQWDFPLQYHVQEGEYWYAIQDWIAGLLVVDTETASRRWEEFRRSQKAETTVSISSLNYTARDNKQYKRDFTNDKGLYIIAQNLRSAKTRTVLIKIKDFLAKSAAFADLVRREPSTVITSGAIDPDKALEVVVEYYRNLGKDDRWINARLTGIVKRQQFTAALKEAVLNITRNYYGLATNEVYLGLWERTAQQLKDEIGLASKQNLRDHQPTLGLMYQALAEEACATKLGQRDELSILEACEIIHEVASLIGEQASATSQYFGVDVATGKPLLKAEF